jgi:hypothetical protein
LGRSDNVIACWKYSGNVFGYCSVMCRCKSDLQPLLAPVPRSALQEPLAVALIARRKVVFVPATAGTKPLLLPWTPERQDLRVAAVTPQIPRDLSQATRPPTPSTEAFGPHQCYRGQIPRHPLLQYLPYGGCACENPFARVHGARTVSPSLALTSSQGKGKTAHHNLTTKD